MIKKTQVTKIRNQSKNITHDLKKLTGSQEYNLNNYITMYNGNLIQMK